MVPSAIFCVHDQATSSLGVDCDVIKGKTLVASRYRFISRPEQLQSITFEVKAGYFPMKPLKSFALLEKSAYLLFVPMELPPNFASSKCEDHE